MFRKSVSIDLVEPVVCLRGQPKDKQTINILRGAIRLGLSHSSIVHSITVQFIGTSKTLWPEASQHWDKHILVDSTIPISKNSLLLKKGTHAFPFEILLSNALSESIECGLGHIRYKLLCQVHVKPRFLLIKSILRSQKQVVLIRLPSQEIQQQQCITQTHVINDTGGQLTLNIERGQLIPGIFLPINFHFNRNCAVKAIDQLSVKLIERQKYKAPSIQTTRILHHEIALSPPNNTNLSLTELANDTSSEIRIVYVVPDKHTLKVRPSTSHPNIRVRHWIQIYTRLRLKDGSIKDLQMDAPISVLLSSMDDYLTLPVYNQKEETSSAAATAAAAAADSTPSNLTTNPTVSHALSSTSIASSLASSMRPNLWLKKLYPIKNTSNRILDDKPYHGTNNNLMLLMTAPPPLYEDVR
ncbi:hypothetical protein INT47_007415 [Mucor saturninus]|uniref:Arrestin C-terminal-like domain-containing protein n=1 Tax=Mucor saturninus TaxID=64648 RepID=A0A8H7R1D1_9FUNG|nr:hypothetical protein INT47_007415 [Mucor saturninus]